jgi:hypothetical protein
VTISRSMIGSVCLLAMVLAGSALVLRPVRLIAQSSAESAQAQDGGRVKTYASDSAEAKIGFKIAPVRLTFKASDRELVGLGSYLVNAAGACNDCHTAPPYTAGRDPFAGEPERINKAAYLAGGTPFGPFVSRNITPDANGLPAGLTWVQFQHELTTGIDLKHGHPQISPFLQVMPWPVYKNLRTEHLRAIYAYLKAIPSAATPEPAAPAVP